MRRGGATCSFPSSDTDPTGHGRACTADHQEKKKKKKQTGVEAGPLDMTSRCRTTIETSGVGLDGRRIDVNVVLNS